MKMLEYVENLIASGKCTFSLQEAEKQLNKSRKNIILSIEHLRKKNILVSPARGFYVIVSPEYRIYKCLPAEFFIPYLMEYWNIEYYAGLLTAATYYGASHQQPQIFQVFISKNRKPIHCGKIRIHFIAKRNLDRTPIQNISTQKSVLRVSTPEATAMDLLNYPQHSGGLNHIVTVLDELRNSMEKEKLFILLNQESQITWKQRLGYLLEKLGSQKLSNIIYDNIKQRDRMDYIELVPGLKTKGSSAVSKDKQWKIIENTDFESDL